MVSSSSSCQRQSSTAPGTRSRVLATRPEPFKMLRTVASSTIGSGLPWGAPVSPAAPGGASRGAEVSRWGASTETSKPLTVPARGAGRAGPPAPELWPVPGQAGLRRLLGRRRLPQRRGDLVWRSGPRGPLCRATASPGGAAARPPCPRSAPGLLWAPAGLRGGHHRRPAEPGRPGRGGHTICSSTSGALWPWSPGGPRTVGRPAYGVGLTCLKS